MKHSGPVDKVVDARGLRCPLPVLRARKALISLPEGAVLRLLASDPAAWIDVPHFCTQAGHELIGSTELPDGGEFVIRRGAGLFEAMENGG